MEEVLDVPFGDWTLIVLTVMFRLRILLEVVEVVACLLNPVTKCHALVCLLGASGTNLARFLCPWGQEYGTLGVSPFF